MTSTFGVQKLGAAAVFAPQLYTEPKTYILGVGDPTILSTYSVAMAIRMSLTFVDGPAPRSRTIVLGRQNRSITS